MVFALMATPSVTKSKIWGFCVERISQKLDGVQKLSAHGSVVCVLKMNRV